MNDDDTGQTVEDTSNLEEVPLVGPMGHQRRRPPIEAPAVEQTLETPAQTEAPPAEEDDEDEDDRDATAAEGEDQEVETAQPAADSGVEIIAREAPTEEAPPSAPREQAPAPQPAQRPLPTYTPPERILREDLPLERARRLIAAAIRRRWDEGLISRDPDGVFTAYLGSEHIEKLLRNPRGGRPGSIDDFYYPPSTPLGLLAVRLDLEPSQLDLLAVLLACEIDPATARLVSYLGGNQSQFAVTIDLLFEIIYRARTEGQTRASALLNRDLSPHGRLRRLRCITLTGADNRVSLAQEVRLNQRVVDWLVRGGGQDPDLTSVSSLYPAGTPEGECDPESLRTAIASFKARDRLLLVTGMQRSGREVLLQFAAEQIGRPLLMVSGRGLGPDRLVASFREAAIQDALLGFRDAEDLLEGDVANRLRDCLAVFGDTVALIGQGRVVPQYSNLRRLTVVEVAVPPHGERVRLWTKYLGDASNLSEQELREISGLYNLGVGGIVNASQSARDMASFAETKVERSHLSHAVRQLFDSDLTSVATRVEVAQTWDDIVLPEDVVESVEDIIDRIRFRTEVLGKWGFARKLGKGLGLTALFSGEPGTGKSMVAGLIANELGLDLYSIDLSRLTSKWLGETEKNLARVFDAAEIGHVLLLFDEADSVLGKRTSDAHSSNDRYANMETNYILARLEQFQGVAFFTTNLASAIDPAVARRMSVHLKFPFPEVDGRAEMWQRMIPAETPISDDLDYRQLAEQYEVSGGFIRNIVVRGAFLAAREQVPLAMRHIEAAAEREYRERGLLLVGGRLV